MAKPAVDISMIGDKELERTFKKLPDIVQRRIGVTAMKQAANESHSLLIQAVSGNPVGVDTGRLLTAFAAVKPEKQRRKESIVFYVGQFPTREQLGIPPSTSGVKDWYYPTLLEYGYIDKSGRAIPARSFLRKPVDNNRARLIAGIATTINKGIIRNMKRLAKK